MKRSQLLVILALLSLLAAVNLFTADPSKSFFGGLPWWGWAAVTVLLLLLGVLFALRDSRRARLLLEEPLPPQPAEDDGRIRLTPEQLEQYDPDGPSYPHPVVITERCIGCHACVDACPHDVLAIVNGVATPVARDQCMEDTACQVECPVNPKACIVVNTTKKIPPRKVPNRDARFMTDVPGCYIVGDVSGTPLIKNATNEGSDCVKFIHDDLRNFAPPEPQAEVEVVIVGVGPAGLSAAITAQRLGLSYAAVEQDRVLATIEAYPANKYVFFKPETMEPRGGIRPAGAGMQREDILADWVRAMQQSGVRVSEQESCKSVKRAEDGDYFVVQTERGVEKQRVTYKARRVILALGLRGTPMKLKVPGEELKVARDGRTEDKVKYKLTDPEVYKRRRIIVVGAGNSAVEAAVDLVATRRGDKINYRPDFEINEVTLVIRSDMKNDLKFGNKLQVYDCIDEGKIKVFFGTSIKEIREDEVVLMNARTQEVVTTVPNDFIFAMIGGDRPTKFLESIGIKIG
ncbi:MAG: NAD(P)-binding domain-containing protein [Acidobacteria bacterium]|nr:NAD(P)-binding domain-containing protein [Acidobacteriota bacterium]